MKNNDFLVSTLPIKPQKKTNIGMMIAPTIMDYIGDVLSCDKMMSFNTLHSYISKDDEYYTYLSDINNSGIPYDKIFIDKSESNKLLEIVDEMLLKKILCIKDKYIYRCDCGMVDIEESAINRNAKLYYLDNDKVVCKNCKCVCKKYKEKSVVFNVDSIQDISIAPNYLKKEVQMLNKDFLDKDFLISKGRNTNHQLIFNGMSFNVDIDFLWSNYFKLFGEKKQIYIASNHQLFTMFFMNYISKKSSDKDLTFVATPYLNVDLAKAWDQYSANDLKEYKRLLLLYNLKWKNRNCTWDDSIYRYLSSINDVEIKELYDTMLVYSGEYTKDDDFDKVLNNILTRPTNMQNNIIKMKLFRK